MGIITLTTDMGTTDHYVAAVKGAILSRDPSITVVDISHAITPFDNSHAAFVLGSVFQDFPAGTVHLIGVNPEADGRTPHVVVRHADHYFIGADNGVFPMLLEDKEYQAYELTMRYDTEPHIFPLKNIFTKAACHLIAGGTPEMIGRPTTIQRVQVMLRPTLSPDTIRGAVVHIDSYGNVITNISRRHFDDTMRGRPFRISLSRSMHDIESIHRSYRDVPSGERVAFFNTQDLLEIAMNKGVPGSGGGAAQLLGLRISDHIRVEVNTRAVHSSVPV